MTGFRVKLTVLFGIILLICGYLADHLAREELRRSLGAKLEQRGVTIARDLAAACSDLLQSGDDFALMQLLRRTKANDVDTRYVFLVDAEGRLMASTFDEQMPRGLLEANRLVDPRPWQLKRLKTDEGMVRDVAVPIPGDRAATVRVGMSDEGLGAALASYSWTLSLTVVSVLFAGLLVSYALATYLTRPLMQLTEAVHSVERGNLTERIDSPGSDEVGQLAMAFNKMTRTLAEKEAMRQALLEKVITSQEDERKRVARDLHDDLAQQLTYVLLRLEALQGRMDHKDEESRAALTQARDVVGKSLAETRRLIGDLRPSVLDDLGLVAALRSHAEAHLEPVGCQYTFEASNVPEALPPVVETAVFRIVQEAVNNIAKHSGAHRARIALRASPGSLAGEVVDDGCGYRRAQPVAKLPDHKGLGLQGMRERASLLGGSLTIDEAEPAGTRVKFCVPLGQGREG